MHTLHYSSASTFWLLGIMLLWISLYKYLFEILPLDLLAIYPKVGLQTHNSVFNILKNHLFSIVAAPICISINSVQGPSFLYILASTCYFGDFWLFWFGRCQAVSHCSFDLHFSDNYQCWPFFHMTIGHLHGFGKMSVQVFCQFFNQVVSFSDIDLCDLLIYLVKCARFI